MHVRIKVETPREVARVAGIGNTRLAAQLGCSVSLVHMKMRGERPWYRREVEIFHGMLVEAGAVISLRSLERLIGSTNIMARPLWSRRQDEVTGGTGRD